MGDRANFGFRQEDGSIIYLYGHWAGEGMMNTLAEAIAKARPRWTDESRQLETTNIQVPLLIGKHRQLLSMKQIGTHLLESSLKLLLIVPPSLPWGLTSL